MPKTEKNAIWYDSADGRNKVAAWFYQSAGVKPFCVLQIAHGMCEHMGRYGDFADFLCENGAAVCGNDHLGHGATAAEKEDCGYFTAKGGRFFAQSDMLTLARKARAAWPGLPLILLGHSMGSFFARSFAARWPNEADGLIISGTGGPNPVAGLAALLAGASAALRGPRYRSPLVDKLAFGAYLRRIPNPASRFDWLSRDAAVVAAYDKDPLCGFFFTANGFRELFLSVKEVSTPAWAVAVRKDMPVLMIQGGEDPVGGYGKGTDKVRALLRAAGVKNLEYILYPGARHEVLNELNRGAVYEDVLAFLRKWWRN